MNKSPFKLSVFICSLILFASPVTRAQCPNDDLPSADELHITGQIHFNINVRDYQRVA